MADLSQAAIMPFLYIKDWQGAADFYRDRLGLQWLPQTPDWVMVSGGRGTALALISEAKRYETSPVHRAGVYLTVPGNLTALVDQLAKQGVTIARPLRRFSHGAEAAISDPDGNVLVLYEASSPW